MRILYLLENSKFFTGIYVYLWRSIDSKEGRSMYISNMNFYKLPINIHSSKCLKQADGITNLSNRGKSK